MRLHSTWIALCAALALVLPHRASTAEPPAGDLPTTILTMSDDERRQALGKLSRDEIAALLKSLSRADLIKIGRSVVGRLGTYRAVLTKQERVGGTLHAPQTLAIVVRDAPLAVRADYVDGPAKGRRVLYNATLRADALRVREAGLAGIVGAIWIGLNDKLTRRDTNHPVTNLAFTSLLNFIEARGLETDRLGGVDRIDEGFNAAGHFCATYKARKPSPTLYATATRICDDLAAGLPVEVEVFDQDGLLERYRFRNIEPRVRVPDNFFTPEGAGL